MLSSFSWYKSSTAAARSAFSASARPVREEAAPSRRAKEVVVLGGGVVGITSAYFLAKKGYAVTVLDRNHAVGRGTSQVNACSLRSSSFSAFNHPGSLWRLGTALAAGDPVFRFQWSAVLPDPAFWRWGAQFVRACQPSWGAKSTAYLRDVSKWSVALTEQVGKDEGLHFDLRSDCGALVAFLDDQASFDEAVAQGPSKEAAGVKMDALDKAAVLKMEPSMAVGLEKNVLGAVHFPHDMHGDCRKFTEELAAVCAKEYGVVFKQEAEVFGFEQQELGNDQSRVVAVHTTGGRVPVNGDVVVCLGAQSDRLAKTVGVRLPIYPMKGYSLTVNVEDLADTSPELLPRGLLVLEPLHTYVIRMDRRRVRFASIAEFAGWDERAVSAPCVRALQARAADWFPQLRTAIYAPDARVLTGGRPQTPDDVPIVSETPVSNMYVNAGHGQYGWRLACSSASILQTIVSGDSPPAEAPDIAHLSLDRFRWF